MKYIKLFPNNAEYEEYVATEHPTPNVSLAVAENDVHYEPFVPPPFLCKLTLNDGSSIKLYGNGQLTNTMINPYRETVVSAKIGDLCTNIGGDAFTSCINLTSISIPSGVISIGINTFSGCTAMTTCAIGNDSLLTSIGGSAFYGCSSLTSITIPNSVTSIGNSAFNNCTSLTSVTIPNGVTSIGYSAFRGCSNLTSVTISNSVTTIGNEAFYNCASLTSVTIPDSVTSISYQAFSYCASLTSVTIGSGVTSIGTNAFVNCSSLNNVTCRPSTPPTLGSNVFNNTNNSPIYVPSGSVEAYKAASIWSTYASRIQAIQ